MQTYIAGLAVSAVYDGGGGVLIRYPDGTVIPTRKLKLRSRMYCIKIYRNAEIRSQLTRYQDKLRR